MGASSLAIALGTCVSLSFLQSVEAVSRPVAAPATAPKATLQNQLSDHDKPLYRWVPPGGRTGRAG